MTLVHEESTKVATASTEAEAELTIAMMRSPVINDTIAQYLTHLSNVTSTPITRRIPGSFQKNPYLHSFIIISSKSAGKENHLLTSPASLHNTV